MTFGEFKQASANEIAAGDAKCTGPQINFFPGKRLQQLPMRAKDTVDLHATC